MGCLRLGLIVALLAGGTLAQGAPPGPPVVPPDGGSVQWWTALLASGPPHTEGLRLRRGQRRLAQGDRAGARADAEAEHAAGVPWADEAAWLRAQASDDCREVLTWLERAPARPGVIPAAARLARRAQAARACGDAERAAADERGLVITLPWTAEAQALAARTTLSDAERFSQAEAWEQHRDYPRARQIWTALAQGGPESARARRALARLALDRERQDFSAAAQAYEVVAAEGGEGALEAAYEAARAWGRSGALDRAIRGYEALAAAHPAHEKAASARFFAGFLRYEAGQFARAAQVWGRHAGQLGGLEAAARWYRAWALYLAEDPAAVPLLEALAQPEGDRAGRRAAYWAVQALAGRAPARAAALAARVVDHAPLGWYALLLRKQHPGVFPDVPTPPPPATAPRAPALIEKAHWLAAVLGPRLGARALRAGASTIREAGQAPALWRAAVALGTPNTAMLDALRHERESLAAWPRTAAHAAAWRAAWPLGFQAEVARAIAGLDVPRWWIHAFIRKESAYRPDVVSRAHAVGLMQLIGPTAAGIAAAGGPRTRDLFDPAQNIAAGAWYVGALSRRFRGQLPLVAAAYNGGPGAVIGWAGGRAEARTDRFVDRIPYREARGYVRRMVETVVRYRMLHGGQSLDEALVDLPLRLDLRVRPGVDF